jgi:hypothetical protein
MIRIVAYLATYAAHQPLVCTEPFSPEGGFYHDGRFAKLDDVVNHYDTFLGLNLTNQEKRDLVQFLLSL